MGSWVPMGSATFKVDGKTDGKKKNIKQGGRKKKMTMGLACCWKI